MYSSLQNHLFNIIHYILAFLILFILFPKVILKKYYESAFENVISNYIIMVFLTIIMGYFLVIIKLYEFLGIFLFLLCLYVYLKFFRDNPSAILDKQFKLKLLGYDYLDRVRSLKEDARGLTKRWCNSFKKHVSEVWKNKIALLSSLLLIAVLVFSAYLRFYDAFINAAPPMSDSYVTLKWMKAIINRILFVDGIYPQGFHIYMATLQKFAFINPLYILRYSGPLNGVLTAVGMYFATSRICKNKTAGIVSAILFGILITPLLGSGGAERQAATNSQEFAYVFVIPSLYFFLRYLITNSKRDFITAFAGVAVTGLVHTISFVFIAAGVSIILLTAMLMDFKRYWTAIYKVMLIGFLSGIVSIIPIGIGFLFGNKFHSSSESFLTESSNAIVIRQLSLMDKIGLASLAIIFLYLLFNFKHLKEKLMHISMFFTAITAFLIYYVGGYLTKSVVVATRLSDFWPLTEPVIIGMAFYSVISIFKNLTARNVISLIGAASFMLFSIFYIKPAPIIPYKMERNINVEQYFKITKAFKPTEWMIVSQDEGYAVVSGQGYHLLMGDFLENYDPEFYDSANPYLFFKKDATFTKTPDIFLFQEKKVFTTQFTAIIDYPLREKQNEELQQWVDKYKLNHSNLSIYYEDNNIRIYRIHQEVPRAETLGKIWGQ